jgi:hypothetical protein
MILSRSVILVRGRGLPTRSGSPLPPVSLIERQTLADRRGKPLPATFGFIVSFTKVESCGSHCPPHPKTLRTKNLYSKNSSSLLTETLKVEGAAERSPFSGCASPEPICLEKEGICQAYLAVGGAPLRSASVLAVPACATLRRLLFLFWPCS